MTDPAASPPAPTDDERGGSTLDTTPCPFCEAELSSTAMKCRFCGEWVQRDCRECGTPVRAQWAARGLCAECETKQVVELPRPGRYPTSTKSRGVAAILAFALGGIGLHKFYLDRTGVGVIYLIFFWTAIPMLLGFFEGLKYLLMDEGTFHRRYHDGTL